MAFKMKGHTLPGPKQKEFEDDSIINSAPKKYEAHNGVEGFKDETREDGRAASAAFQMKSPIKHDDAKDGTMVDHPTIKGKKVKYSHKHVDPKTEEEVPYIGPPNQMKSAFRQTETDLKDWLLDERGFSQVEADQMITTGAYDTSDPDFKAWYAESGRGDVPAEDRPDPEWENADEVD
tara:strand:- start:4 stop:537 length:534 start_codon:yes stop_codon:yes gene_type:complete